MMGYLVLQGGSEFSGHMAASDRRALALAGGADARISIIPAAAAPDANHHRAGETGCQWFRSLGARNVTALPIINQSSAGDPELAALVERSNLIYLLGGFPEYLLQTMTNSLVWQAAQKARYNGAVVAGSSAGAMVMCEHLYDPDQKRVIHGLKMLPGCCVLPHHNRFGRQWADFLEKELPDATLIGIDEHTAIINDGANGRWTVYGGGRVTLYRNNDTEHHATGAVFNLSLH